MTRLIADKYYSLNKISKEKWIPWATTIPTLRKWVEMYPDLFMVVVQGSRTGRRYHIKGSVILAMQNKPIHDYR